MSELVFTATRQGGASTLPVDADALSDQGRARVYKGHRATRGGHYAFARYRGGQRCVLACWRSYEVRNRAPTVNLSQMDIEPHAVQIGDFDLYDVLERKCGGGLSHQGEPIRPPRSA
jgi:hypothetical protein